MATGSIFGARPGSIDPNSVSGIILTTVPTITCLLCYLVPAQTILKIRKHLSTRDIPLSPFLSMFLQGLVWTLFGVLKNLPAVLVPSAFGLVFGSIYVYSYDSYSVDKRANTYSYSLALMFMLFLAVLVLYLPNTEETTEIIGLVGSFCSVAFMASPLVAILQVIKEKSVSSMPFNTSVTLFANGLAWWLYGYFVVNESVIWVPNFLGILSGVAQLSFHAIYETKHQSTPMI